MKKYSQYEAQKYRLILIESNRIKLQNNCFCYIKLLIFFSILQYIFLGLMTTNMGPFAFNIF